jgi:Rrf2 family protein
LKLSTKGKYGLRAIIDLAKYSQEEPVSISNISNREGISEGYLEQIVSLLKKAGLVLSIRGASGGYELAKKPEEISVGEVLRALEGDLNAVNCTADDDNGCSAADRCISKMVWKRINDSINQAVDTMYLSDLLESDTNCDCYIRSEERAC